MLSSSEHVGTAPSGWISFGMRSGARLKSALLTEPGITARRTYLYYW